MCPTNAVAVRTCFGSRHNALHSSSYIVCTFPLLAGPSQTGTGTDNGRVDDFILSQNVYGESVIPYTTCQELSVSNPSFLQIAQTISSSFESTSAKELQARGGQFLKVYGLTQPQ